MATQTTVQLVDDLDGGEAEETVNFALDGSEYEIDLSKQHADDLREALAPFVVSARRLSTSRPRSVTPQRSGRRKDLGDVRAWANENGYTVSDRGRIPTNVIEAYDQVH